SWHRSVRAMLVQQEGATGDSGSARPPETPAEPERTNSASELLQEPLSQREVEVLTLIHAGHANKEIAARMEVAPATVKAHIRNLYGKLGVGRRTEALARARELGLLDT
ncbi:MAG: response regulator transcription factor, partial [Marinobacter sp.]|nr:response regulator transcription factor [Marinobacter sp.]